MNKCSRAFLHICDEKLCLHLVYWYVNAHHLYRLNGVHAFAGSLPSGYESRTEKSFPMLCRLVTQSQLTIVRIVPNMC